MHLKASSWQFTSPCFRRSCVLAFAAFATLGLVLVLGSTPAHAAQLTASWSDATPDDHTGFKVERKTGTNGAFAQVATTGATVMSYIDTTLTAGTTYCYRVRAYNTVGDSPYTAEACAVAPTSVLRTLTVAKSGTGTGTVDSSPSGITCGGTCSATYTSGTTVSLSAAPATGTTFTGWSGACTGTGGCAVVLDANKSATATFALSTPTTYALTVTTAGAGTGSVSSSPTGINCGSTCSASYTPGTNVTLTAAPATGSTFTGWSGACSGTGNCVASMTAARSVTATFAPSTYGLTVTKSGTGSGTVTSSPTGVSCGTDCTETYTYNTNVTLTAAASAGSTFTGWSGACTGTGTCTVSMTAARSATAAFTATPVGTTYPLSVTKAGTGTGTVTSSPAGISCGSTCSATYAGGTSVTLTATPAAGSTFTGWSGACSGTGSCALTVGEATSVTATFALNIPPPAGTGLVAAYGFNEGTGTTVADASGKGHIGTVTGATWTTNGKVGNALTFNGTSNWVTVADAADLDLTTGMTLEAWVYPTATTDWRAVLFKETATGVAYALYANTGTNQPAAYVDLGAGYVAVTGATALPANTWSHLAMTFDGATLRLFVNGTQTGSGAAAGSLVTSNTPLRLGGTTLASHYFAGRLDDVRIYNRALTPAEIQTDLATAVGGTPAPPTSTLSVTKAGAGTGTITSNPTGVTCGSTCSATYTSGTSVTLTATPASGSTFTMWSGACSGTGSCVVSMTAAQSVTATFALSTPTTSALTVTKAGTGSGTVTSSPSGINCGSTCSASYNSGTSVTLTAVASAGSTFSGWTGACTGTGICVAGMTAAKTVTANFALSTPTTYALTVTKSGTGTGTATSSPAGISCGDTCSASYTSGTSVTLTATPTTGATFTGWGGACAGTGPCTLTMNQLRDVAATFTATTTTGTGLVAAYSFSEGTGKMVADASGKGHTGTVTGAIWTSAGKFGSALTFDGRNDVVTINDSNLLDLTSGLTISAWVYPTTFFGTRTVVLKERSGGLAYGLYANDSSSRPAGSVNTGGADIGAAGSTRLPLNTWSHLATTYDGTSVRLFVNGVQVGSRAMSGTIVTSAGVLRIGGNSVWGQYFRGRIDEVRIYNRPLGNAEIQQDMQTPVR